MSFVKFPFELYKNCPQWVPPLIKSEIEVFDKSKNVFLKTVDFWLFLAYKNNTIVGRFAAFTNREDLKSQNKKLRFGWIDFIDDPDVSQCLFDKIVELAKANDMESIEGPVGISTMDKAGLLIKGFERMGKFTTIYNYQYYLKHFEQYGFLKRNEWIENGFQAPKDMSRFKKLSELVSDRYKLRQAKTKTKRDILKYMGQVFDLMNVAFEKLPSFTKLSKDHVEVYQKKYSNVVHDDFVSFILDSTNAIVAFGIAIPDLSKAFRKANGRLLPFGIYHIMKAFRKNTSVDLVLIGIHPSFQNKGLHAMIFDKVSDNFARKGISYVEVGPILEENTAMLNVWSNMNAEEIRRRRTFILPIKD